VGAGKSSPQVQIADIKHDEKPKKGGPGDALMMIVRPSGDDGLQKYSAGKTIGSTPTGVAMMAGLF
jgi:hypothetical protein